MFVLMCMFVCFPSPPPPPSFFCLDSVISLCFYCKLKSRILYITLFRTGRKDKHYEDILHLYVFNIFISNGLIIVMWYALHSSCL